MSRLVRPSSNCFGTRFLYRKMTEYVGFRLFGGKDRFCQSLEKTLS
jgi:hypothetical protein